MRKATGLRPVARPAVFATPADEPLREQGEHGIGRAALELLEDAVGDDAAPAAVGLVLVDLEADFGVGAHHLDLPALDRLHVDVPRVPDVDHGHDVRPAEGVAPDAADQLPPQERRRSRPRSAPRSQSRSSRTPAPRRSEISPIRGAPGPSRLCRWISTAARSSSSGRRRRPAPSSCRHCRASAIPQPLPGQLSTAEAERFLDALAGFGTPRPVLVATGGDVLMRDDLDELAARAAELRLPLALAPSVTPLLTAERVGALRRAGVKVASISLDGATAATHEGVRGVEGHFAGDAGRDPPAAPAPHHGAGEHRRDARHRRGAAGGRPARQGVRRLGLGGLLPRPGRSRLGARRADRGRERACLPLPRRRLASRVRRANGRGAVLPARHRPAGRGGASAGRRALPAAGRGPAPRARPTRRTAAGADEGNT